MSNQILKIAKQILSAIILVITLVERPADGGQKKKEAIQLLQNILKEFLPAWSIDLFLNQIVLGYLIDYLVDRFNAEGEFVHYSNN